MKYISNGEIIEVYFHKELRDIFKNTFRTAKWNGADRSKMFWYVKNTTANTNKLNKFVASLEVQERVKYLAEVDHADMPEAQELALHEAIRQHKRDYGATMNAIERLERDREALRGLKQSFASISKGVAKKVKVATTANADMRSTYEAMLAPFSLDGQSVGQVLIEASQLAQSIKTAQITESTAKQVQRLVVRLEWLKGVQEQVKKSHLVNFSYLTFPLTAAHVFYTTVHSPEQVLDWLYNTAILEIPLDQNTPFVLERQALSANVEEAKPARARFKI